MRRRLWFSSFAVAVIAVLIVGVPALVVGAGRGAAAVAAVAVLMVAAAALAGWLTACSRPGWPGRSRNSPRRPRGSGQVTRARSAAGTGWPTSIR